MREIAITEHLFRFAQVDRFMGGFFNQYPESPVRAIMEKYWADHAQADLDVYMEVALEAKAAGLPIVVGMEVDYYQGRMHEVSEFLAGYPFDVLLGSVHWLGAWPFASLLRRPLPQCRSLSQPQLFDRRTPLEPLGSDPQP